MDFPNKKMQIAALMTVAGGGPSSIPAQAVAARALRVPEQPPSSGWWPAWGPIALRLVTE